MEKSSDPRTLGARCDECPLAPHEGPVPSEVNPRASVAFVGEAPGEHEVREGRPFTGPSGSLLTQAARQAGLHRRDALWTNVVLCRPPENDMGRFLEQLRRSNRAIDKRNRATKKEDPDAELEPIVPTPMACCRPRLLNELEAFSDIVTVGGTAAKALVNPSISVMAIRGGPTEIDLGERVLRILPTLHPSFVLRAKRWSHVFRQDLSRAVRWFRGQMGWEPPHILYHPDAATLERFLADPAVPYWTYDVETDGIEALTANIRCIAIGTPEKVVVVGTRSISGSMRFYPEAEQARVEDVLRRFFVDPGKLKCGHNAGYYDKLVIEQWLGVTPEPLIDTMLMHRLVESELPHSLGFVGSMYTDAPSWKTDREGNKRSLGGETDHDLHEYCAYDVAVTAAVVPPLFDHVRLRQQEEVMACDHRLQEVCAGMHRVGMHVDQAKRLEFEREFVQKVQHHRSALQDIAGIPDLNPGSVLQMRRLLFEEWRLQPPVEDKIRFTKAGDPSTSDDVLRACMTIRDLTEQQRLALGHIRYYRRAQKMLGTYVTKLRYNTMEAGGGWDEDDTWAEIERRKEYGDMKVGITDPLTGRMHPGYNAHVTTSGRLSSSKPINAQNFPFMLRAMVNAAPGHVLVGADADQLELRIAASRWQSRKYLEAFELGLDPHSSVTAYAIFGERFVKAAGSEYPWKTGHPFKGNAKRLRNLSKSVQYASQYWATVETVHRVITQTETANEDGTTTLPYLRLSLREVRMMHDKWVKGARFEDGWERELTRWRRDGFLAEPVMGRRRDFLDGENPNEIVNFPIQAAGASLMNIAILRLRDAIPFEAWGPGTGIINQCHDSIMVECPESEAPRVAKLIEECMNLTHPDLPGVIFTATAEIGPTWADV